MTDPQDAIGLCLAGAISPQVAISRLMLGGADSRRIRAMLDERAPRTPRWDALSALLAARRDDVDRLSDQIGRTASDHAALACGPEGGFARLAAFFDQAVAHSPEAGVALYSLGDPAILAAATSEIVDWLAARSLLPPDADVLDLGCGAGRVAFALAGRCRSVLGLDVSAGMVAEARRRCGHLANLRFSVTDGQGRDALAPESLDLILAVDSFPYVTQAGPDVTRRHVVGAARALRAGGALVVLNLSYGRTIEEDRADAAAWASDHGFILESDGERPFAIWDGSAFVLRRGARHETVTAGRS